MTSSENFANWRSRLEALDSTPCMYSHHLKDTATKSGDVCDADVQNRMHGCAHAMRYQLLAVIEEMSEAGILPADKATTFGVQIRQQKQKLFGDDVIYQLEDLTTDEMRKMAERQTRIIEQRALITAEVLEFLASYEGACADSRA